MRIGKRRPAFLMALLAGGLASCSADGQVAGPTGGPVVSAPAAGPQSTRPEFRDGWSSQPIAAEITPATPAKGTTTLVRAPGYLAREARFDGRPYYLWPCTDESYVRTLVYDEPLPDQRLIRWEAPFQIAAAPEVLADARVPGILEHAAGEASRATGLAITVRDSGGVMVTVEPADPYFASHTAVAYARRTFRGFSIVSTRIVFRDMKYLLGSGNRVRTNTLLHEVGHALGLGHSPDPRDVMHVDGARTEAREFSDRERVTLRMMYQWRRPGNAAPDREAGVGPAVAARRSAVVE